MVDIRQLGQMLDIEQAYWIPREEHVEVDLPSQKCGTDGQVGLMGPGLQFKRQSCISERGGALIVCLTAGGFKNSLIEKDHKCWLVGTEKLRGNGTDHPLVEFLAVHLTAVQRLPCKRVQISRPATGENGLGLDELARQDQERCGLSVAWSSAHNLCRSCR